MTIAMQHPFKVIEPELRQRLAVLKITRRAQAERRAAQLVKPVVLDHFRPVHEHLGIPIVWMVSSFERESGSDFTRSPAQGDRWDRVSVNVPRGVGPFKDWPAAADWSYRHDGIDKNSAPWDEAYACYAEIKFNGFGPIDHGHVSGYAFSGTDQYDKPTGKAGKYVSDGVWNPDTQDEQLGCVALWRAMIALDPSLAFPVVGAPVMNILTPIPVTPTPEGFSDALLVQQMINKVIASGAFHYEALKEDGNYGRRTRNAVRAFQTAFGLEADGIAGPKTKAKLRELMG